MSRYAENNSVMVEELKDLANEDLPPSQPNPVKKSNNLVPFLPENWKSNKENEKESQVRHRATCNCTFCTHEQPCHCIHCINNPCNCVECVIARGPFNGKGSSKENQKVIKFEHGIQVNGRILKEIKEMIDVTRDQFPPEHIIVHNRAIDNIEMEIIEIQCNGQTTYRKRKTRVISLNEGLGDSATRSMSDEEKKNFIRYWNSFWIPSVSNEDIENNKIPNLQMNEMINQDRPTLLYTNAIEENTYDLEQSKSKGTNSKMISASKSKVQAEPIPLLPKVQAYIMSFF